MTVLSSTTPVQGDQKPVRNRNLALNVMSYGAFGDGATDDTAAIAAAIAAAKAFVGVGGVSTVWVYFPRGAYPTTNFTVPGGVALYGDGYAASRLLNRTTTGGVFLVLRGSNSFLRGLFIDGQMAAQGAGIIGTATVQFSRPNAMNAAARPVSGGVVLSSASAAGATSITVANASPGGEEIRPGDIISVIDPSATPVQYEMVRVSESYVAGSLTLPLKSPTVYTHGIDALCSVAATNVGASDCKVLGNGRDGIAFWHVIHGYAHHNVIMDYQDTGLDLPAGGSRYVHFHDNSLETQGRWGIAFDSTSPTDVDLGRLADCHSSHNSIVFLPGGSYVSGNTIDGIFLGKVDRCSSVSDRVNLILAGISGADFAGTSSTGCRVVDIDVIGPPVIRAGTAGVRLTNAGPITMSVTGGHIQNVSIGVDTYKAGLAMVRNVGIENVTSFAVNMQAAGTYVQRLYVLGCNTDASICGVRCGGTPTAGSKASVTASVLLNYSSASTVFDAGWDSTLTANT